MLPDVLLWLFPVVFVLHEAEETAFLPSWLHRRGERLSQRFPHLSSRLLPYIAGVSRRTFACIAAEELLLVAVATPWASATSFLYPWLALFLAFGVHLVGHLLQILMIRRYVPVVATSLLGLACCGWGLRILIGSGLFSLREYLLCGVAGCIVAAVNLWTMHALAATLRRRPRN